MATSATTTASQPTRLLPNSHREPRMLSAVACASPATIRDSSTIAENIPNTARTRYSSPVARARRWIGRSLPGGSSLVDSGSSELGFAQGVGGSHVVPSGRGRQIREGRLGVGASGCR